MIYESRLRPELKTSLVFDRDLTFGELYRTMRTAKEEREAIIRREKQLDPVLFREVRDLERMMELVKQAFIQANA